MDYEELYEEMYNARDKPVLVEGPNDKRALEKLGFTNVTRLSGPLYSIVEQLMEEDEVLILTDLDQHGKGLYRYFYNEFTKRGVRINNKLRVLLFGTPVRQIEGLATYLEKVYA